RTSGPTRPRRRVRGATGAGVMGVIAGAEATGGATAAPGAGAALAAAGGGAPAGSEEPGCPGIVTSTAAAGPAARRRPATTEPIAVGRRGQPDGPDRCDRSVWMGVSLPP